WFATRNPLAPRPHKRRPLPRQHAPLTPPSRPTPRTTTLTQRLPLTWPTSRRNRRPMRSRRPQRLPQPPSFTQRSRQRRQRLRQRQLPSPASRRKPHTPRNRWTSTLPSQRRPQESPEGLIAPRKQTS